MDTLVKEVTRKVQLGNDISQFFMDNARANRGLPEVQRDVNASVEVTHRHEHTGLPAQAPAPATVEAPVAQPVAVAPAAVVPASATPSKPNGWLKKAAIAAALLAGGGGATAGGMYLFGGDEQATQQDQSLLQYLEDEGLHMPAGSQQ